MRRQDVRARPEAGDEADEGPWRGTWMKVARDVPTVEVDRTPRTPGGGPDGVDLDEYIPAADSISVRRKRLDDEAALARGEAVHRTAQRQHCQKQSACQPDEPRATLETHGVPPFPSSPATGGAVAPSHSAAGQHLR